jgi:hypothetical protein
MKRSYHKKFTKKNKKVGGFSPFRRLKEKFGRTKKPENKKQNQSELLNKTSNNFVIDRIFNKTHKSSRILDKLFSKLCKKKAKKYLNNPIEENKGISYRACRSVYSNLFNEIDSHLEAVKTSKRMRFVNSIIRTSGEYPPPKNNKEEITEM